MRALLQGARAETGSPADAAFLDQKTDIGTYYALIKGMDHVGQARAAMALFEGTEAGRLAAQAAIDSYYEAAIADAAGGLIIELVGVVDDPFAEGG